MPVDSAKKSIGAKKENDFKCLEIIHGEAGMLAFLQR
jgi:hypothetical protein